MKIKNALKILTIAAFLPVFLLSCTKTTQQAPEFKLSAMLNEIESGDTVVHKWYYFDKDGIVNIDLPQNVPITIFKPWTETVRVSGGAKIGQNSFLLVNRLGLVQLPNSLDAVPEVVSDALYFTDTTANDLVAVDGHPVFSVYRNSFFNAKASENVLPFLIQYRTDSKIFFPLLKVTDLGLSSQAETVHLLYDGNAWTASFKTSMADRTNFDYLQFYSLEPLISLSGKAKSGQIQQQNLTLELFKKIVCQFDYADCPERMSRLLLQIPEEYGLDLTFTAPNSGSPRSYIRAAGNGAGSFKGKVKDDGTYITALFSDGTVYFSGALPNSYILRGGAPVAFRLPKLPEGFIYNDFAVSGNILYASWEEELFYQTGRAGIIALDLKKILYDTFLQL